VDFGWMQPHLRVYAAWLWELCTAPILPFEFTAVTHQFSTRLEELDSAPGVAGLQLGAVAKQARHLERLAARLDACAQGWRTRYRMNDRDSERAADVLNGCLKRLSNILIPIQSTVKGVYGHDPYGFTPQLSVIPCLYETKRLAELEAESEEWLVLETHLRRQRNRVADAVADASAAIENTLAQF